MAKVLAISSHVVRGHVGLAATVPALQYLGHEVWALPTVLLSSRPGLGRLAKRDMPAAGAYRACCPRWRSTVAGHPSMRC
jgi:pyridoxine kinase